MEGVGEDIWPGAYDPTVPHEIVAVDDAESFAMTRAPRARGGNPRRRVERHWPSSVRCAWRGSCSADAVMVVLLPDGGRGYLGKIFNDGWIALLRIQRGGGRGDRRRRARSSSDPAAHRNPRPRARPPDRHRARGDRHHDRVRRLAAGRAQRRTAGHDGRGWSARSTRKGCSICCSVARRMRPMPSARTVGERLPLVGIHTLGRAAPRPRSPTPTRFW